MANQREKKRRKKTHITELIDLNGMEEHLMVYDCYTEVAYNGKTFNKHLALFNLFSLLLLLFVSFNFWAFLSTSFVVVVVVVAALPLLRTISDRFLLNSEDASNCRSACLAYILHTFPC